MPGLDTTEIVVAAGSLVATAPAGTAAPADPTLDPPVGWVDLGYINEDGVTWTESPDSTNLMAWQSADPVKVVVASITRTFAFNLMQWSADVLEFVLGGDTTAQTGPPAFGRFIPSKVGPAEGALLLRWESDGVHHQLWCPRGKVTGDVSAQLVRTTSANFAATFTATPSGSEDSYWYDSDAAGFGTLVVGSESASKRAKAEAA